jgi:hypothetical protein
VKSTCIWRCRFSFGIGWSSATRSDKLKKIGGWRSWQELGAVSCFRDGSAGGRPELEKTSATGSGAPVSKLVTCHRFMIMRGIEWDHYKNVFQTKSSVSCRRERCFLLRASFDNHSDRSSGWGGVAFHCKNKLFESALQ